MTNYVAWGFDFSFGNGLTIADLKANGCQFICRYLSGTPDSGKNISATEIINCYNAGIAIVFNWETTGLEYTQAQGTAAAVAAQAELAALAAELVSRGAPAVLVAAVAIAPVYFSLDTAPNGSVIPGAEDYQRGVVSVLGLKRSGAYGGEAWITTAFDKGLITYGWQTYAWSNAWEPRAQLQQYQNGVTVGPAQVDRDRATAADFGQCKWNAPPPPPPPTPAPPAQLIEEEENMLLLNGQGAVTPLIVPAGAKSIRFAADEGAQGLAPAKLRVAFGPNWEKDIVEVSWLTSPVAITLPAGSSRVTIARMDAGNVNVSVAFAA